MSELINAWVSFSAATASDFEVAAAGESSPVNPLVADEIMRQRGGYDANTTSGLFLRPVIDGTERRAYSVYLDDAAFAAWVATMSALYSDFTLIGAWRLDGAIHAAPHSTLMDYCGGEQVVLLAGQTERALH